ncbi:MAG: argininosuccinate lyase [Candidatus Micrarchaeota archaeon]
MKLWDKGISLNKEIEKYTVGNDYLLDLVLVKHDCMASIAHAKMLAKIGVLSNGEKGKLISGLNEIIKLNEKGKFKISPEDEDCHTAIEKHLTKKYGEVGKKIHTGRSRNDQVLTALRLYEKEELGKISSLMQKYCFTLKNASKKYANIQMPGYTHMQKAMPTTIGTWLECYENSMQDNLLLLKTAAELIDQSPLGTGAGFGIPVFKLDRKMTAKEMKFSKIMQNPIYAQHSRGKFEGIIIGALSAIMYDLNKLASDMILFSMPEFGYISLPTEFCTGSSIMPQKKNPDVLELMRAKYYVVLGEEFKVKNMIGSLISGYNRDTQLTKEPLINSVEITKSSLQMASLVVGGMKVNSQNCKNAMSKELFATQEAYKLAKKGMPFRDAYKKVGEKYKNRFSGGRLK